MFVLMAAVGGILFVAALVFAVRALARYIDGRSEKS